MSNDYREGAKALLDLKKKDKKKKKSIEFGDDKPKDDNRDVEAAVLKYVAGTLDNGSSHKKRKKSFNAEDISDVNEFQHWNSFLDTEQLQNADDEQQQQQQQQLDEPKPESKKHKKHKKKKTIDVDPELANLDDAADHEQLVRAAILDANQLAQDANVNIQDYIENPNDNQELHNTIIQAAEAVQQQKQEQQNLAAAAVKARRSSKSKSSKNPTLAPKVTGDTVVDSATAKPTSTWVRTHSTGKLFSKEETEAIDKFLMDFCAIHNLTRKELCERIWLNERKREILWDLLHQLLPERTRASIYKHVRRSYHIFEVRGKWTAEDDQALARLYIEKAGTWKAIGMELGRMPEDCRDRYRNYIKCGQNRVLNKWSVEEEDKLKQIIAEFISEQQQAGMTVPIINWTIVSEKMGGVRSRIQCRYKWNKLLKREATQRAEKLSLNDRVWLLSKIQELGEAPQSDLEWETLASLHPKEYWTGDDFKVAYNRMKVSIRDRKQKSTSEICQVLLQDAIQEANRNNLSIELPVVLQHFEETKRPEEPVALPAPNAENIANAAINNSTRNNEEYVSWR